jgi:DNA-directed RNA polymerase subunit beta
MGSNMQQSCPTIRPIKPIVGTGLESRVISDIGGLQAKRSGFVSYVEAKLLFILNTLHY